jgi:hypothetical protein
VHDTNENGIALRNDVVAQYGLSKGIPIPALAGGAQSVLEEPGAVST